MSTTSNRSSDFDRFEALTRRILTTPKAELVKSSGKAKPRKHATKKRK